MVDFTKNIDYVTPTDFVNDENINLPLSELENNLEYVLNFLNGNKLLIPALYGNLFDFNATGKRILFNGGQFDSLRKCNMWTSLTSGAVTNDAEISYDSVNNMLVYEGQSPLVDSRNKWIEREIYIPEILRDQEVLFSIKATGSTSPTYSATNATTETIGIQILGGRQDVIDFAVVGLWDNFNYYTNPQNTPPIYTYHLPFVTARNTQSVKIKILRTLNINYLLINKMFLGGMTFPYQGYTLNNIDINELYDFNRAISKITSTGVMGHKVPESYSLAKGSDIVTVELLAAVLQQCLGYSPGTSGTSGSPSTSGSSGNPMVCSEMALLPTDTDRPIATVYPNIFNYSA